MSDSPFGFSDAAKRCSDIVTLHAIADPANHGKWCAIRLSDGGSDDVVYDTRADAIAHQLHEKQCAYVKITWNGMLPKAAETYLRFHRGAYDAGYRLPDPETTNRQIIDPLRRF